MNYTFFEELQSNAFPALQTVMYDGWSVRFGGGFTLRVNCANPMYAGTLPAEEKIDYVESLYSARSMPTMVKVHDGMADRDSVNAELDERGYAEMRRGNIFICDLEKNAPKTSGLAVVEDVMTDSWLTDFLDMNGTTDPVQREAAFKMLKNIAMPIQAASIVENGRIIACGLGVYERGYVGLYDIFVDSSCRRRGLGAEICSAIMAKGKELGAHHAYLQVLADNFGARKLYYGLGYEESYEYWFRVKAN